MCVLDGVVGRETVVLVVEMDFIDIFTSGDVVLDQKRRFRIEKILDVDSKPNLNITSWISNFLWHFLADLWMSISEAGFLGKDKFLITAG